MAAPFILNDKIAGIVRIGLERESMDRILEENRRNMLIFSILIVLIALLAMWLLFHNQNRHLAGRVEMERQLDKAERLSALGQLAAGVAHEIRNPLNAVSMASQRLKREFLPADENKAKEFESLAGVIRDEIRRLNGIIEEFLTFSKSRKLEFHDYPVAEVLQKIVNLIREEATAKGISIQTHWESDKTVIPMDVDKLQQALLNIIKNAMESIDGAGSINVAVERKNKEKISIKIADTGCGMTSEEVERIFSPDYTTKEKGLGLGLPLAHEIIRGHSGEILVFSDHGLGTTFEINLPIEKASDRPSRGEGSKGKGQA
jgi:signal transduction histidine kinase